MEDTYGNLVASLAVKNDKRIVLLVMDGLGDCDNNGKGTALQMARKPNLDALAARSATGLITPVATAITPGSGPGHLGLFGYDPIVYQVGRGVLSALGVEFPLEDRDVAARLNFCTMDPDGIITDRRAGRIKDEENRRLLHKIKGCLKQPPRTRVMFETEAEHRAVMVLRGEGLDGHVGDTDPQITGVRPLAPNRPPFDQSRTAIMVADIIEQVQFILDDEPKANMILARGFAKNPALPKFSDRYQMTAQAVAGYPMYRGVAKLLGMPIFSKPTTAADVCAEAAKAMKEGEFVFAHFKYTDKTGEDGLLDDKVTRIEELDAALPALLAADPDVLIITGDHSTPPSLRGHSWHPVPVIMKAPHIRGCVGRCTQFDEITCRCGEIGTIPAKELLPLAMAHAMKLEKFGA